MYFRDFPKVRGGSALFSDEEPGTTLLLNETFGQASAVTLGATESEDTASFSVSIAGTSPAVSLSATEGPDTAAFTVATVVGLSLSATEGPDTAAFSISVLAANPTVGLAATEEPDIASFSLIGPDIPQTGGGAGDYFTSILNFAERRRRVEEELRDDPSPEVVTEAAQLYADDLPKTVDLEAAQAQVAALIEQQTRLSAYLQALVYAEVARALEVKRQAEIEEDDAEAAIALQLIFTQTL